MAEVGRPSILDDALFRKIRELVLDGADLKTIAESLGVSVATVYDWSHENYQGFADRYTAFRHERMLKKAEIKLETLIEAEDDKVALNAAQFALETLNKKHYSKRQENTGADGKDLPTPILNVFSNLSDKESSQPQ